MRALVTGAGGFLGSHLAERLLGDGVAVRALARPTNVPEWLRQASAELAVGDLRDPALRTAAVEGVDVVFHAASLVTEVNVPDSEYRQVNVEATAALALAAARAGARRFVHVSSTGVHRPNTGRVLDEATPLEPDDAYGRSKADAERRLSEVAGETGIELVIVRPSRIYGPRDASLGRVYRAIAARRFPLVGRCDALVDFVYVSDVVDALAASAMRGAGVYLVGGPERVPLARFFEEIAAALGTRLLPLRLPFHPTLAASRIVAALWKVAGREPPVAPKRIAFFRNSRFVDVSRAARDLGYAPKVAIATGVRVAAEWYRGAGWV
jgi:nucleoside-diphosphate-sugar epimerase